MQPLIRPSRLWVVGAATFLLGTVVGGGGLYYVALRPALSYAFQTTPFLAAAGNGRMDTLRLERIESGNVLWVADSLEADLDQRLRYLSAYEDVTPITGRDEYIYDSIRRMAAYRIAHPRPPTPGPGGPTLDSWTKKALSLASHHAGARPNS